MDRQVVVSSKIITEKMRQFKKERHQANLNRIKNKQCLSFDQQNLKTKHMSVPRMTNIHNIPADCSGQAIDDQIFILGISKESCSGLQQAQQIRRIFGGKINSKDSSRTDNKVSTEMIRSQNTTSQNLVRGILQPSNFRNLHNLSNSPTVMSHAKGMIDTEPGKEAINVLHPPTLQHAVSRGVKSQGAFPKTDGKKGRNNTEDIKAFINGGSGFRPKQLSDKSKKQPSRFSKRTHTQGSLKGEDTPMVRDQIISQAVEITQGSRETSKMRGSSKSSKGNLHQASPSSSIPLLPNQQASPPFSPMLKQDDSLTSTDEVKIDPRFLHNGGLKMLEQWAGQDCQLKFIQKKLRVSSYDSSVQQILDRQQKHKRYERKKKNEEIFQKNQQILKRLFQIQSRIPLTDKGIMNKSQRVYEAKLSKSMVNFKKSSKAKQQSSHLLKQVNRERVFNQNNSMSTTLRSLRFERTNRSILQSFQNSEGNDGSYNQNGNISERVNDAFFAGRPLSQPNERANDFAIHQSYAGQNFISKNQYKQAISQNSSSEAGNIMIIDPNKSSQALNNSSGLQEPSNKSVDFKDLNQLNELCQSNLEMRKKASNQSKADGQPREMPKLRPNFQFQQQRMNSKQGSDSQGSKSSNQLVDLKSHGPRNNYTGLVSNSSEEYKHIVNVISQSNGAPPQVSNVKDSRINSSQDQSLGAEGAADRLILAESRQSNEVDTVSVPIKGLKTLDEKKDGGDSNSLLAGTTTGVGHSQDQGRLLADVSPLMSHKKLPHEIDKEELGRLQSQLIQKVFKRQELVNAALKVKQSVGGNASLRKSRIKQIEAENKKMFARLSKTKSAYSYQSIVKQHKARRGIAENISQMPFVLNHSPNRNELEWNVDKTDRLNIEASYEQTLRNLNFLLESENSHQRNGKLGNSSGIFRNTSSDIIGNYQSGSIQESQKGSVLEPYLGGSKMDNLQAKTRRQFTEKLKDDIRAKYPGIPEIFDDSLGASSLDPRQSSMESQMIIVESNVPMQAEQYVAQIPGISPGADLAGHLKSSGVPPAELAAASSQYTFKSTHQNNSPFKTSIAKGDLTAVQNQTAANVLSDSEAPEELGGQTSLPQDSSAINDGTVLSDQDGQQKRELFSRENFVRMQNQKSVQVFKRSELPILAQRSSGPLSNQSFANWPASHGMLDAGQAAKQIIKSGENHYLVEIKFISQKQNRRIPSKSSSPPLSTGSPLKNYLSNGAYKLLITANNLSGGLEETQQYETTFEGLKARKVLERHRYDLNLILSRVKISESEKTITLAGGPTRLPNNMSLMAISMRQPLSTTKNFTGDSYFSKRLGEDKSSLNKLKSQKSPVLPPEEDRAHTAFQKKAPKTSRKGKVSLLSTAISPSVCHPPMVFGRGLTAYSKDRGSSMNVDLMNSRVLHQSQMSQIQQQKASKRSPSQKPPHERSPTAYRQKMKERSPPKSNSKTDGSLKSPKSEELVNVQIENLRQARMWRK